MNIYQVREKREAKISINDSLKPFLKKLHMSLFNLQLENNTFLDNCLEAKIQLFFTVRFFDRFQNKVQIIEVYITSNRRR